MSRLLSAITALSLCGGVALGAVGGPLGIAGPSNPFDQLGINDGEIFVPTIEFDDAQVRVLVPMDGVEQELVLHSVSYRADSFQVWAARDRGVLEAVEVEDPKTYQGRVVGAAGSLVGASIIDGEVWAYIVFDGRVWGVQPVGRGAHVSYVASDVIPVDAHCGVDERFHINPALDPGDRYDPTGEIEICVPAALVAFDTDFEFFQWSGGEQETIDQIELVMNAVDVIYHRDAFLGHLIGDVIIRTSPDDPYSGDIIDRLFQFQAHWNSQQQGVVRDVAHLFSATGFSGVIGVAWVGVPCREPDFAYGASVSNFTGNMISRVALTAHELGHNWGAGHCDGDDDCGIMCSFVGGCANDEEHFGAASRIAIQSYVSSVANLCLEDEECFDGEPAASGLLFGNTLSNEIGTLDALGGFVPIAMPGFDVDGMAYDRNRKIYFLTDTRDRATLYRMREFDSRIFVVGPFDGASRIAGLAFDPNADRLFGVDQAIGQLYLIEPQEVDDEIVALATPIGPEHGGLMGGLAYDEIEDVLYAVDDAAGSVLYSIDTATGMRTEIGPLGLQDCDGLGWRPADESLYTIDGLNQSMYTVDKSTGESAIITQFRDFGIGSTFGMAFGSEACLPDINEDGEVDAEDFFAYLDLFAGGDPSADLTGSGDPDDPAYGVPDGVIDADDFFFFLDVFTLGCA